MTETHKADSSSRVDMELILEGLESLRDAGAVS
jgi:hypothetical protein